MKKLILLFIAVFITPNVFAKSQSYNKLLKDFETEISNSTQVYNDAVNKITTDCTNKGGVIENQECKITPKNETPENQTTLESAVLKDIETIKNTNVSKGTIIYLHGYLSDNIKDSALHRKLFEAVDIFEEKCEKADTKLNCEITDLEQNSGIRWENNHILSNSNAKKFAKCECKSPIPLLETTYHLWSLELRNENKTLQGRFRCTKFEPADADAITEARVDQDGHDCWCKLLNGQNKDWFHAKELTKETCIKQCESECTTQIITNKSLR